MKQKAFRILLFLIIPILILSLILFFVCKKSPFRSFCDTLFIEEISGDTLGLHYTLARPEKFDIDTSKAVLPLYSKDNALSGYEKTQQYLETLHGFTPEELTESERYTYDLLSKSLSHNLEGKQYFYLQEVFSPSGGTQIQYPILMAEYPFRCKEDIENYLSLLEQTPSYFESLCEFEKEKFARGYGMADYSLKKVMEQCNTIVTDEAIENNRHFLITTFTERISKAMDDKLITKKEATKYISQNRQILSSCLLPAYKNLASALAGFYGSGKNIDGLCYFSEGQKYYEWLFQSTTGSDKSMEEVYDILAKDYYNSMENLQKNLLLFQEENTLTESELSYFPLTDCEEMLAHLEKRMAEDFPSSDASFTVSSLSATVKKVSPALEDFTAPAYYLIPPLDDNSQNSIYINESSVPNGLELYTTLAHEGYPGHLYQTTYYQFYREEERLPYLRSILNYGGYVEGWALYTELLSYNYASELLVNDTGKEDYKLLYDLYKAERRASLSMLALLDVGIHYYGLDFERTKELLDAHGIDDEQTAREVYEYIVEEPTNYPKYYWGYLEILALKEDFREQMGEYYSDYAFHQYFLESGPSDFSTLSSKIKKE